MTIAEPFRFNQKVKDDKNTKRRQYLVLDADKYEMAVFDLELISSRNSVYWDLTRWFRCPNLINRSDQNRFNCWPQEPDASSAREMARKTIDLISRYRREKKIAPDRDYLDGFSALMKYQDPINYCDWESENFLEICSWSREVSIDFL